MTADDTDAVSGSGGGTGGAAGAGAARQRHKRTRTGCLKCRIRRRKCDEGKPQCQRCIDGNFECQYGPRLTFLNKNALTVSPSPKAADAAAAAATPKYSRLQFVGPGTSKQNPKDFVSSSSSSSPPPPQRPPDPTVATEISHTPASLPPSQTHTPTVFSFQANLQSPDHPPKLLPLEPSLAPASHNSPPPPPLLTQWRSRSIGSIGHESLASPVGKLDISVQTPGRPLNNDAAYETALDVLLSLGNEGTGTGAVPSPGHGSGPYAVGGGGGGGNGGNGGDGTGVSPRDIMSISPASTRERRVSAVAQAAYVSTPSGIPQDRLLQLLRHFRYQVAPWLDLCDMSQTFGLYVPRLAIEDERVLHCLLAVAAVAQQAETRTLLDDVEYLKSLAAASPVYPEGVAISDGHLAHLTLWTACQFTSSIPDGWQSLSITMGDGFWRAALAEATPKTLSILSVLIRFELAAALVTGVPICIPEHLHHHSYNPISQPYTSSPIAESIFQCTIEPLLLCAQVVNLCAGSPPPRPPPPPPPPSLHTDLGDHHPPPSPVQRWTQLSDALAAWYAERAQEFRPMVEMDGDESLFPVLLFTNGAAVLANQLYHTAMLLLLQNRPRTLRATASKKSSSSSSSSSSPLWHARRVCGIALNNDRRDSWDLCLVASLYLAAQRMTYEPQQRAVLGCFDRVRALTGWDVDGFAARAREDWGLMM
ncbi:C6 transcription factor [Colletotrichum higginsianum IMI 349063]|uniref:C6 transcription factor n=1 Tax=Colletotrichum higginsianum (strain IMI 349063) TaxID=759273 RepID=A0A1B7YH59_COLHI|nr:C6 transcription factor [Colletotrichum higginsianum IMI 349063]OBR11481.1 C6 transcription factor [Colletotrichum higginsianum IMI 349063]